MLLLTLKKYSHFIKQSRFLIFPTRYDITDEVRMYIIQQFLNLLFLKKL